MAGVCLLALGTQTAAMAYTINVTVKGAGTSGNPASFRWLVEEDNSTQSVPGVSVNNSIGIVIHKSYAPVVASGHATGNTATITVPDGKWYFVSVLPDMDLGPPSRASPWEEPRHSWIPSTPSPFPRER